MLELSPEWQPGVSAAVIVLIREDPDVDTAAAPQPNGDSAPGTGTGLGRRDRDILAFERQWWQYAGAKEQAIKDRFDLSPTR